jgi:hypothetical protein
MAILVGKVGGMGGWAGWGLVDLVDVSVLGTWSQVEILP